MRSVNNEMIVLLKLGLISKDNEADVLEAADKIIERHKPKKKTASRSRR